eukprot:Em0015g517a
MAKSKQRSKAIEDITSLLTPASIRLHCERNACPPQVLLEACFLSSAAWAAAPSVTAEKVSVAGARAECFLTSPAWAAAPAQIPASDKVSVLSGEVTQMLKAAGLPLDQFWTRTSAGLV